MLYDRVVPTKVKCFIWLAAMSACFSHEALQKRGINVASRCSLCVMRHLRQTYIYSSTVKLLHNYGSSSPICQCKLHARAHNKPLKLLDQKGRKQTRRDGGEQYLPAFDGIFGGKK